jgi:lauroyl/myristoyl acyltransferase
MEIVLYLLARGGIWLLQALPLTWVARLGRLGGGLVYYADARHRRVACRNLAAWLGEDHSTAKVRALARENFRRIGENFACAVKTASMTWAQLQRHVEFVAPALHTGPGQAPKAVVAIGHFGNFELYARFGQYAPGYQCATTYRGLRQPSLDRLLQSLRAKSGCRFFERRFDGPALREFMNQPGVLLGLLADQHAGTHGLRLPFLGRPCSTSPAPAVFALRYQCGLYTGICYRVGLARWRIEASDEIPTHENDQPRSTVAILLDINRAFEAAVRRDPANWFWVHNRWKGGEMRDVKAELPGAPPEPSDPSKPSEQASPSTP